MAACSTVDEPHLIARYNKALRAFGLQPTTLQSFEIDMTGFSPEIAEELGDRDYLDPNAVNRRFIILTPAQDELPVVHTAFSNTSQLMHEFFASNSRAINAVTIKDALYGEIEDSVAKVKDIDDLLSINEVRVSGAVGRGHARQGGRTAHAGRPVEAGADAWRDDAMLEPDGRAGQGRPAISARMRWCPTRWFFATTPSGPIISAAFTCSSMQR